MGGMRFSNPLSFFEDVWPDRFDSEGHPICRVCNRPVQPPRKVYCSHECYRLAIDALDWRYARRLALERAGHRCEFPGCGKTSSDLEVHHIIPVWRLSSFVWGELNRDPDFRKLPKEEQNKAHIRVYAFLHNHPSNLMVLCRHHHNMVHAAERRHAFLRRRWDRYEVGEEWRAFWRMSGQSSLMVFLRGAK